MYYYAEVNSDFQVVGLHALDSASTNANYIAITADQYADGSIVGKFYNRLTDAFEILDIEGLGYIGETNLVRDVDSDKLLSTILDNMQVEINEKAVMADIESEFASINHTHDGYATAIALDTLSETVGGKANAVHTHSEYAESNHNHDASYAPLSHSHSDYVTTSDFDALSDEVDGKANANHSHSNYAETTHTHTEYSPDRSYAYGE